MNTGSDTLEIAIGIFTQSLNMICESVEDIPVERMTDQPSGLVNHPLWTLNHLASAAGLICTLFGEIPADARSTDFERFGPGSTPQSDAGLYDDKDTVLAKLAARHERAVTLVRDKWQTMSGNDAPERFRALAPTVGHIAMYLLTTHEAYHLGQLMQWRRAAGLKK